MIQFGLLSVGLLLGIILALVAVAAYLMFRSVSEQRAETRQAMQSMATIISRNTRATETLRSDVTMALARMDADKLHDASQQIQVCIKQFSVAVGQLSRLMYAQQQVNPGSGYDPNLGTFTTPAAGAFSVDDEATDDARMLAERQRWNREQAEEMRPNPASVSPPSLMPMDDPFAGMTTDQRAKAVQDFFAARRSGRANPAAESVVADMQQRMAGSSEAERLSTLPDFDAATLADEAGDNGEGLLEVGAGELEDN